MSVFDSEVRRNAATIVSSGETPKTKFTIARSENLALLDERLRKLLVLIEADPLGNSQDWALTLNISNSHLQHVFKKATGIALGQALAEKRLQKAARLLTTTNLRIKEIASAVGYEHTSSFTRAFERRFAQAPRHFRIKNAA
jgi:transcriptional regulator GlxA family with amidase domain